MTAPSTTIRQWISQTFEYGDCRDACWGTLLRAAGMDHPEDLLFPEWNFIVTQIGEGFRDNIITLRDRDPMAASEAACGLRPVTRTATAFDEFLLQVRAALADGGAVAITVDHWFYPHSQFFRSAHMPHHLLVLDWTPDGVEVLDPYAYTQFSGTASMAELHEWTGSAELAEFQFHTFWLAGTAADRAKANVFLADTWRAAARSNVRAMTNGGDLRGAAGIHAVADRMAAWVSSADFAEDVRRRRKLPTTSFLETGANRRGHAMWLRRASAVGGGAPLADVASRLAATGRSWDVVSAVRHLYQESAVGSANSADPAFLMRKLGQLPRLLHALAESEQQLADRLADVVV
jgi:hypothetical protein